MIEIKNFFALIDSFIYNFIAKIYQIIEQLAFIDVFSDESINSFSGRIYTILGIFMLFKVSFSFINYLIDPDKFVDKSTGFSKMIVNIIIVFILLISVPWGFSLIKGFQKALLTENILPNFILGQESSENHVSKIKWDPACDGTIKVDNYGDYISLMIFRPFYQYNDDFKDDDENTSLSEDAKRKDGVLCVYNNNVYSGQTLHVSDMLVFTKYLAAQGVSGNVITATTSVLDVLGVRTLDAVQIISVKYQVNYMFFLSTLVGIAICGLLLSFALDIAVRSIKMGVLQLIAPIPIISYIDPDKSKHKMFTNWLREVGKTWISLFIRLGAIYLCIYILELLDMSNLSEKIKFWSWINLFMIIGALIFAKKLPSWIESLFGIKFDGEFTINPLKKIKNEALGGKQLVNGAMGAVGAGVGLIGSAAAHGLAYNANRKKFNEENSKLNEIKVNARNSRLQGIQNYRNARSARNLAIQNKENAYSSAMGDIRNLSRQIGVARANGDQAEVNRLMQERKNRKQRYISSERPQLERSIAEKTDEMNSARRAALENAKIEKQKIAEQQEKVNEIAKKPILKNPIGSAAGEIARGLAGGAKNAYQADTLNVGKIVSAGLKGTDEAAMKRNYREDFSIRDEFHDRMTSFARIKNESGTSSEIDKEIKKLRSEMTREMNTLNQLNNMIANLSNSVSSGKQAEAIRITSGNKDDFVSKYKSYDDYKSRNSNTTLDKEDFDKLYEAMSAWVKTQKSIDSHEKNIKKYEKMQESQNKRGRE